MRQPKSILTTVLSLICLSFSGSTGLSDTTLNPQLSVNPVSLNVVHHIPNNSNVTFGIEVLDMKGEARRIRDIHGKRAWQANREGMLTIQPELRSYSGPLQLKVAGKVVDRFSQNLPPTFNLVLTKVLSHREEDGTLLQVSYTDFALESVGNQEYPQRVLEQAVGAYRSLKAFGFKFKQDGLTDSIKIYIGGDDVHGIHPFGGYLRVDYRRSPLFAVRFNSNTRLKQRVILLPADYSRLAKERGSNLVGTLIHEMTHAFTYGYNQNLGSTERNIRSGDWYTEGLARYLEFKFTHKIKLLASGREKQSLFDMSYEAASFWSYFEARFGIGKIIELSERLDHIVMKPESVEFKRLIEDVTGESFDTIWDQYSKEMPLKAVHVS